MEIRKKYESNLNIGKVLLTFSRSKYLASYQAWYLPFKEISNEIVFFDTHWNKILYGKEKRNKMFLEFIEKEKPDYLCFGLEDFDIDTLLKIRLISPKTKIIGSFPDDDLQFEGYSRYAMLFFDYGLVLQRKYVKKYKEEGIKNVFEVSSSNPESFKPLNLEKKYDITFIGAPMTKESGRYDFIKFLKEKGVSLTIFGWGWEKYPDLKDIYKGPLSTEEMARVLNQSKINLCFSRNSHGEPHSKGKVFEGGSCKTFVLTEYSKDYLDLFKEGKDIIMFKTKEELLDEINYFLKQDKERQKIADTAYKTIMTKCNLFKDLEIIFGKIKDIKKEWRLPEIKEKSYVVSKKEMSDLEKLTIRLKDYNYVSFKIKGNSNLNLKDYLQIYSLKMTKKPISCCSYYVYKRGLGDYLNFSTEKAFNTLSKKELMPFLSLSQLVVEKNFFLENFIKFEEAFKGKIDFLNDKNTALIRFPLLRITKIPLKKYDLMKKVFIFDFFHDLYSLYNTKKIFYNIYVPSFLLEIISGKFFLLRYLIDSLTDKNRIKRLKNYQIVSK
jgi:hypothetical protein